MVAVVDGPWLRIVRGGSIVAAVVGSALGAVRAVAVTVTVSVSMAVVVAVSRL